MLTLSPDTATAGGAQGEAPGRSGRILLVATPVALIVLAAGVVYSSFGLGYWTRLGPGPGFFPFWIGLLLGVSSAVWLIQALRGSPNVGPQPVEEPHVAGAADAAVVTAPTAKKRPLWVVLVSLVVLAGLLEVIGFQLGMFAFLLFQLRFQGGRKWPLSLAIAALGSFGVFYLFTEVLQVTLPTSSIDFLEDLGL